MFSEFLLLCEPINPVVLRGICATQASLPCYLPSSRRPRQSVCAWKCVSGCQYVGRVGGQITEKCLVNAAVSGLCVPLGGRLMDPSPFVAPCHLQKLKAKCKQMTLHPTGTLHCQISQTFDRHTSRLLTQTT